MEFAHTCFLRGHENLLESIKQTIEPKESREEQKLLKNSDAIGLKRRELKNKFFSAGGISVDTSSEVSD